MTIIGGGIELVNSSLSSSLVDVVFAVVVVDAVVVFCVVAPFVVFS